MVLIYLNSFYFKLFISLLKSEKVTNSNPSFFKILINLLKRDAPFDLPILNLNLDIIEESFGSDTYLFVNSNG